MRREEKRREEKKGVGKKWEEEEKKIGYCDRSVESTCDEVITTTRTKSKREKCLLRHLYTVLYT